MNVRPLVRHSPFQPNRSIVPFGIFLCLSLIVQCVSTCTAQPPETNALPIVHRADRAPEKLSIATWNLEWFFDDYKGNNKSDIAKKESAPSRDQWQWRVNTFAAAIAKFQPTILAVEEIEDRGVLLALTKALKEHHQLQYRVAFIEGNDSSTEQDVGILYQSGLVEFSRKEMSQSMFDSKDFYSLSKHIIGRFEWADGDRTVSLEILVLHLRATADAADLRKKQAKLAHQWMKRSLEAGQNVIILGDLNVEQPAEQETSDGDGLYELRGLTTSNVSDDLVDLLKFTPADKRQTHLILPEQFDRILASPTLVDGTAGYRFTLMEVLSQHNIRGNGPDEDHWDTRYTKDQSERDLSDHHPIMATFELSHTHE